MSRTLSNVRPELVEGLPFFVLQIMRDEEQEQDFDKLSPNGGGAR